MRKYLMKKPDKPNQGVYAISLVEEPAMESNWVALKENQIQLKAINDKEQILLGCALIPDKPIYRNDEQNGEYLIEFSKDAIKETAHKFIKTGNQNNATVNHEIKLGKDVVNVVESWLIEDDVHDKTRKFGINEPVGSWAVKMKVNDPELYEKASNGELKGISIEGLFDKELVNLKSVNMSKTIAEEIRDGFKEALNLFKNDNPETDVKLGNVTLKDGEKEVVYEGEELVAGVSATLDGEPVPVGEHETADGQLLVVEEAGTISEIKAMESEEDDDAVDAEKDEIKKAIAEAVMNLKKEMQTESDTKLSNVKKGYETKITELEAKIEKLEQTPNKSVQTKKEFNPEVKLNSQGRLLQTIRNI